MEEYSASLACKGLEYKTFVNGDISSDDELTFEVKGVKIHVEFDGSLYIEDFANYSKEQLSFLTLYQKNNSAFLTNYVFTCHIPVDVVKNETGKINKTFMTAVSRHEGTQDNKVAYLFRLLNAKSERTYIDDAISELQSQLSDECSIRICGCCKYGQANPYGGDVYLNFLCFRKNKARYLQFPTGVDKKDWEFFLDKRNTETTRPTYNCKEFESYIVE